MSGATANIHQILAVGAMDSSLTGQPEASLFRFAHVQTTRFSIDDAHHALTGNDKLNSTTNTHIQRSGDLIESLYVTIALPGIVGALYKERCGLMAVKEISMMIGSQQVDKCDSLFLLMQDSLHGKAGKELGEQIGRRPAHGMPDDRYARNLYVPIPFYFNRSMGGVSGNALPLIGLQFHQVTIKLTTKSIADLIDHPEDAKLSQPISAIGSSNPQAVDLTSTVAVTDSDARVALQVGYVYLDSDERQRFSTFSSDVLIRQVQPATTVTSKVANQQIRLYFNHPVNQILVAVRKSNKANWDKTYGEFDLSGKGEAVGDDGEYFLQDGISTLQLRWNNQARLNMSSNERNVEAKYFRTVAAHQSCNLIPDAYGNHEFIYPINFAMDTSNYSQPSGSVNMSRIDNCVLECGYADVSESYDTMIYATNYNLLKFKNGMAGLGFGN